MLKHRKPQKSILSGEFGDPYGRAGDWGGGGLFFESPGNFPGPNANFKIKTCRIVA